MNSSFMGGYGAPILASEAEVERDVYSEDTWQRMQGYKDDLVFDPTISAELYRDANQAVGNRNLHISQPPASMIASQASPSPKPKSSKPKVQAALASWCGFSKKAHAAHKQYDVESKIETLWCDKGDKSHELCRQTRGFPTYYQDGKVLKRGYPSQNPQQFYTSL